MKKFAVLLLVLALFPFSASADEAGCFRLDWFDGGAMGIRFIDIPVDADADMICLWPTDTVHDVILEKISWDDGIAGEVIYTCDALESNQVLRIQGYLMDVLPAFRVTCTNPDGKQERWYITDSGKDGSLLLLLPEQVESTFIPDSLAETEEMSSALLSFLSAELTPEDRSDGEKALFEIWEEARILAAGKNGSNESAFLSERDAAMQTDGYLTAAEMTREHVYTLYQLEVPAISADGSLG